MQSVCQGMRNDSAGHWVVVNTSRFFVNAINVAEKYLNFVCGYRLTGNYNTIFFL